MKLDIFQRDKRVRTPTVLQMEAVECGAAALASVLGYYGRPVPLEELRVACGVSRDGIKASNVVQVARDYGLIAKGYKKEPEELQTLRLPLIVFWNFNHFVVVEGFGKDRVYLNDPASGPRVVSRQEFDQAFTGVVLTFEPGPNWRKAKAKPNWLRVLAGRLAGSELALTYVVLASLALVIPGLLVPTFSRVFVDSVLVGGLHDWVRPLLIGMGLTAVVRAALTWLQQYYLMRMEAKLALSTSSRFFWHVLRLPIEFFVQRYGGEIGSRVTINNRVAQLLSRDLATTTLSAILVVFYTALMFQYDVTLTLLGISMAVLNIAVLGYLSRKRVDGNQQLLQERGRLLGTAMGGLQIIETLKASGSESDFFARWAGFQAKAQNAEQRLGVTTQVLMVVPPLLSTLNTAVILAVGGLRVMSGDLTVGMLVAFQSLMASFSDPFNQIVNLGARLQEAVGDVNRLDDVMSHPPDKSVDQNLPVAERKAGKLSGLVEMKHVTFGYSRLAPPIIEDFNLCLKPGSRVALVGGSGSGKTTVSRLVAGLYEPWSGEILFDGQPRSQIQSNVMTDSLALVDQEIFLFEGTLRENLTLWDPTVPDSNIVGAAMDACIHEDISNRSGGYGHHVEEDGRNYSGGQRQRLEIARALVNAPTILVLDEATSALDPVTEQIVGDHLRRRGCTCLIVAHRLSTIRDCDEIVVLENGKAVQRGTHEDLYRSDGPYARLIQSDVSRAESPLDQDVPQSSSLEFSQR
jgi:NHLM bacteriocin system ABC transporter peptidase/ATP-binding protein